MIVPELKALSSTEVDLSTYRPSSEDFCVTLDLQIGPKSAAGADLFYLSVCSPQWLLARTEKDGLVFGTAHLISDGFNLAAVRLRIEKLLSSISGEDWTQVARKLSKYMAWEYDD